MRYIFLAVISKSFIPTAKLPMPTGTPINEPNAETETKSPVAETETRKRSK